jgi:hypothetical protein
MATGARAAIPTISQKNGLSISVMSSNATKGLLSNNRTIAR